MTFAQCVFELSDVVEARILPSGISLFTTAVELPKLIAQMQQENNRGQNIYVGANPRKQYGTGCKAGGCDGTRCGKCDRCVKCARCLFADFDNTTPEQVRDRLAATKLPPSTIMVFSGHGVHCYWRLTEPMRDLNSWTRFQKDLAALLDSDPTVHNPSRIMRLPAFLNHKNPAAMSYIIEVSE